MKNAAEQQTYFGLIRLFSGQYQSLSDTLNTEDVRQVLQQKWSPPEVSLPAENWADEEALAAIIRITGGNFRLLHRLLTQVARVLGNQ